MKTTTARKVVEPDPRTTCPVCGDTEKTSDYNVDVGMCSKCLWFLDPTRGGVDHGNFMVRVSAPHDGPTAGVRFAEIRPRGFWSGIIEVHENINHVYNDKIKTVEKNWDVRVSWGSGGTDGTQDSIRAAENFTRAMDYAVMLARLWKMQRQQGKEV